MDIFSCVLHVLSLYPRLQILKRKKSDKNLPREDHTSGVIDKSISAFGIVCLVMDFFSFFKRKAFNSNAVSL